MMSSMQMKASAVACLPTMLRNRCSIEMRLAASRAVVDAVLQELIESAQLRAERFNSAGWMPTDSCTLRCLHAVLVGLL